MMRFFSKTGYIWFLLIGLPPVLAGERPNEGLPAHFPTEMVPARCIGPSNMGGRVTEIALDPGQPGRWVIATATGGLWITENEGKTWATPFDRQFTTSIGAVALNPANPKEIWVGTGEPNARNSVSQGNGIYFSPDNGKTWVNKGLPLSRHIGRIAVDPFDPKRIFAAAIGPLWSEGGERGLYLSENQGFSWKQVLPIPADVGCVDVQVDPHNPKHWLACAYRVRRDPFSGGNPLEQFCAEAGLYHSVDGGLHWTRLARGLPGVTIGRCGIDFDHGLKGRVLAVIQTEQTDLSIAMGQNFTEAGKEVGSVDTGGVYESLDGGESWKKINDLCPRPFYFSQIRTDPSNPKKIWVLGIPLFVSNDGGKTFRSDISSRAHPDHHALAIDKKNPKFALLGNDGGLYSTKDWGRTWNHHNNMVLAQFYAIDTDKRTPYRVMGGLQDNGSWIGQTRTGRKEGILSADWSNLFGADGFQARQDPVTQHIAFLESQYGGLRRHDFRIGLSIDVRPRPVKGEPEYRFNWNSPVLVSRHQANTVYFGGNFLFRSREKGANWQKISPDLTLGKPGPNSYSGNTLTTIAEDKKDPQILWAGTDDGLLHLTKDDGKTWLEVGKNLPLSGPGWITSITALEKGPGCAMVTVDRHRNGDNLPYLFLTTNGGETWTDQSSTLNRFGILHAYAEHPENRKIAFLGTENGLAMTLDGGDHWIRHDQIPNIPVHGLAFATTEKELAVGTHGRGAWIVDISRLETLASQPFDFTLVDLSPIKRLPFQKTSGIRVGQDFIGQNPPNGSDVWVFLPSDSEKGAVITIEDDQKKEIFRFTSPAKAGFHRGFWEAPPRKLKDPSEDPNQTKGITDKKIKFRVVAQWNQKRIEKPLEIIDLP